MTMRNENASNTKPVVLVTGATRAQGRGVVQHLLHRGRFAVRALVKNPGGMAAQKLRELGAEIVRGDTSDRDGLRAAMEGAHGVFAATDLRDCIDGACEQEIDLLNAVRDSRVAHLVYSTLPRIGELGSAELDVRPTDLAARLESYARRVGAPATFLHIAWCFEELLGAFLPRPDEDGRWHIRFPHGETGLAGVAAEDIGGVAATIFERRSDYLGRTVRVIGDERTPSEYAAVMSRITGRPITYEHVPLEMFTLVGTPGATEVADVLEFYRALADEREADIVQTRVLYPAIQRFERWMMRYRERLEAALDN